MATILRLSAAFALSIAMLVTSGDGFAQAPKRGGTLNVGLHIDLLHYDWQATVAHPFPHVMGQVFEGLTAFGKDFSAVPEIGRASCRERVWYYV